MCGVFVDISKLNTENTENTETPEDDSDFVYYDDE
jgi:hypothetical protein